MNSVAQVALGILILGAAFIFGSQLRSQPKDKAAVADKVNDKSSDNINWQRPDKIEDLRNSVNTSDRLIDLPVAKRRVGTASPEPTLQKAAPGPIDEDLPKSELFSQDLKPTSNKQPAEDNTQIVEVEPDFSQMELSFLKEKLDTPGGLWPSTRDNAAPSPDASGNEFSIVDSSSKMREPKNPAPIYQLNMEPIQPARPPTELDTKSKYTTQSTQKPHEIESREYIPASPTPDEIANRIPAVDSFTANDSVRSRVPFGLTAQAKSRLVRLNANRSNRIRIETDEFVRHTSVAGESLQQISQKYYGTPDYYLDIYLANKDILQTPAAVPIGTKLKIPLYK